jgi:hypothetical protein
LCEEALTFFLRFFDQRGRRTERYFLVTHCPPQDQERVAAPGTSGALPVTRLSQICHKLFRHRLPTMFLG